MFPYRDENETLRAAIVTGVIIALNVLVWIMVQGAGSTMALARSVCNLGLIPGELTGSLPVGTRFPIGDGLFCATDPGRLDGVLHGDGQAVGDRWPRLHDHDEREVGEGRSVHDHRARPFEHPRLPPDRPRSEQEDKRGRGVLPVSGAPFPPEPLFRQTLRQSFSNATP